MFVDLNSCNIDIVNDLDDQIISVCQKASKVNNKYISDSIKTRDPNTQCDTMSSFNRGVISNNSNVETIFNKFEELIVNTQDLL